MARKAPRRDPQRQEIAWVPSAATTVESERGEQFVHPEDGSVFEEFTQCSDCHTGGKELYE